MAETILEVDEEEFENDLDIEALLEEELGELNDETVLEQLEAEVNEELRKEELEQVQTQAAVKAQQPQSPAAVKKQPAAPPQRTVRWVANEAAPEVKPDAINKTGGVKTEDGRILFG